MKVLRHRQHHSQSDHETGPHLPVGQVSCQALRVAQPGQCHERRVRPQQHAEQYTTWAVSFESHQLSDTGVSWSVFKILHTAILPVVRPSASPASNAALTLTHFYSGTFGPLMSAGAGRTSSQALFEKVTRNFQRPSCAASPPPPSPLRPPRGKLN
ncbi:hypothetical protein L227DRAFT_358390 [Lentinus tigrinus ALCF2SS1-6]|uniref:Uncharacterized protein n=1 Tax=Lentinus tigrinus ALCF2SS1-6 TaxID=1328759 RepID=A0A5C2SIL9_9APHY|nr:hypothetical protein L227DRAFT_358390 [Lentinus tigrinus ALCF2SS1-6]